MEVEPWGPRAGIAEGSQGRVNRRSRALAVPLGQVPGHTPPFSGQKELSTCRRSPGQAQPTLKKLLLS